MDTLRLHRMYEMHRHNRATHAGGRRHLVRRIVIVGGGPVGLYAAYRHFTKTGVDVWLVEKRADYSRKHFVEMDELFLHEVMWILGTEYDKLTTSDDGDRTGHTGLQVVCAKLERLLKSTLLQLAAYVKWMGENADRDDPSQLTLIYNARFTGVDIGYIGSTPGFAVVLVPYTRIAGYEASTHPETNSMEVNDEWISVEGGRKLVVVDVVLCTGGTKDAECRAHLGERLTKTERQRYGRVNFFKGGRLAVFPDLGDKSFAGWSSAAFSAFGLHIRLYGIDQLLQSSEAQQCVGGDLTLHNTITEDILRVGVLKDAVRMTAFRTNLQFVLNLTLIPKLNELYDHIDDSLAEKKPGFESCETFVPRLSRLVYAALASFWIGRLEHVNIDYEWSIPKEIDEQKWNFHPNHHPILGETAPKRRVEAELIMGREATYKPAPRQMANTHTFPLRVLGDYEEGFYTRLYAHEDCAPVKSMKNWKDGNNEEFLAKILASEKGRETVAFKVEMLNPINLAGETEARSALRISTEIPSLFEEWLGQISTYIDKHEESALHEDSVSECHEMKQILLAK